MNPVVDGEVGDEPLYRCGARRRRMLARPDHGAPQRLDRSEQILTAVLADSVTEQRG
jgi:hypothetical protein